MTLRKTYYGGTHRVLPPRDTLAKIEPHLSAIGVTRCADVTDLDRIGIPVFCAIRPLGKMISGHQWQGPWPRRRSGFRLDGSSGDISRRELCAAPGESQSTVDVRRRQGPSSS